MAEPPVSLSHFNLSLVTSVTGRVARQDGEIGNLCDSDRKPGAVVLPAEVDRDALLALAAQFSGPLDPLELGVLPAEEYSKDLSGHDLKDCMVGACHTSPFIYKTGERHTSKNGADFWVQQVR